MENGGRIQNIRLVGCVYNLVYPVLVILFLVTGVQVHYLRVGNNRMKQFVIIGIGNQQRVCIRGRHELFTDVVACHLESILPEAETRPFIVQPVKEIDVVPCQLEFDGTLCNSVSV